MPKILLVKSVTSPAPFLMVTPPLGLMYISSVLRQKGHDIRILDMRLDKLKPKEVVKRFKDFKPDIVGFSALTLEANLMHQVAALLKKEDKRCKIIVGGPHSSSYPQETLSDKNIDFLVLGEGEQTAPELVEAIEYNRDFKNVRGIAFRYNGQITLTLPRPPITDLDSLPFPAWDLIEMDKYFQRYRWALFYSYLARPYMTLFTSRGCPYHCIYCHNIFGKAFRARSPESVMAEIETLINRYNIRDFEILDDCFNFDLPRAKRICDLIVEKRLNVKLALVNGVRGDIMDEELIYKLKKAGTYLIMYGVETASPCLQKFIKKYLNLDKIKQMISITAQLGISTHGYFMLGFPTESKEEILKTIKFAVQTDLETATFYIANPFGGTELLKISKQLGKNVSANFDDYSYDKTNLNLSEFEDKKLFALQRKAYRMFYLNRKRAVQILANFDKRALLIMIPLVLEMAFSKRRKIPRYSLLRLLR